MMQEKVVLDIVVTLRPQAINKWNWCSHFILILCSYSTNPILYLFYSILFQKTPIYSTLFWSLTFENCTSPLKTSVSSESWGKVAIAKKTEINGESSFILLTTFSPEPKGGNLPRFVSSSAIGSVIPMRSHVLSSLWHWSHVVQKTPFWFDCCFVNGSKITLNCGQKCALDPHSTVSWILPISFSIFSVTIYPRFSH